MGIFRCRIEVGNPQATHFEAVDALVDTGATYTWIPGSLLERLGYGPAFTRRLRLADGSVIERSGVQALVRINEEALFTLCLFGDEGSEPLLGAVTLEEFSLGVDPLNRRLVPVISLLV